jgi:uncharacterized membrane protein
MVLWDKLGKQQHFRCKADLAEGGARMDLLYILLRWLHFLAGITWIGILYYFNFVQTPFFAETDAPVRGAAIQKLVPRALWWFRWGAMFTVLAGVAYLLLWWGYQLGWSITSWTVSILTGGSMGLIMWGNVWFCIWPNQQVVIANASAVAGGAAPNPAAAPAGRRASLASRTNTLFSIPMLFFMGAASHYSGLIHNVTAGGTWGWLIVAGGLITAVEINALVGAQGSTKKPLDSVSGTIISGLVLWILLVIIILASFA